MHMRALTCEALGARIGISMATQRAVLDTGTSCARGSWSPAGAAEPEVRLPFVLSKRWILLMGSE